MTHQVKFHYREDLKDVPDQITNNINRKEYLAATQLIVQARENLQGPLLNVDALKEVRSDLETKQEVHFKVIIKLFYYLCKYIICISAILQKVDGRIDVLHLREIFQRYFAVETLLYKPNTLSKSVQWS